MFWNKKDEKRGLPDLPPIKSPFSQELTVNPEDLNKSPDPMQSPIENNPLPTFPDSPSDKGFSQAAIKEAVNDTLKNTDQTDISPLQENTINKPFETPPSDQESEEPSLDEDIKDKSAYVTSITSNQKKPENITKQKLTQPTTIYPRFPELQQDPIIGKTPDQSSNPYLSTSPNLSLDLPPTEEEVISPSIALPQIQNTQKVTSSKIESSVMLPPQKNSDLYVKIDKFLSAKKVIDSTKQQLVEIDNLLKKIREIKIKEERELTMWEKEIFTIKEKISDLSDNLFEKTK